MIAELFLGLSFLICADDSLEVTYFSKCIKEGLVTDRYLLGSNSSILRIQYAEQWKSGLEEVGSWKSIGDFVEWFEGNSLTQSVTAKNYNIWPL